MAIYNEIPETYKYLIDHLNRLNVTYMHMADLSGVSGQEIPEGIFDELASKFEGAIIFNGGYGFDLPRAESRVSENNRYLVSMGVPFISNPDLIDRIAKGAPYNDVDQSTFYTPGEEGYLTYPTLDQANN